MKAPILGNQTFLSDNIEKISSFEKFINENYLIRPEPKPMYTGRYFVVFEDAGNIREKINLFENTGGFRVAEKSDFNTENFKEDMIGDADVLLYNDLGIALVGGEDEQVNVLLERADRGYTIVPEKIAYVPDDIPSPLDIPATWGLTVTRAVQSQFAGRGVRVAVLDTGFDINHPDFAGRNINASSFVTGEGPQDGHGHGTHCIGTACGFKDRLGQRYGVAHEAEIYSGKVLSNAGSGAVAWIINGIDDAARAGCKVISMSLGSRVLPWQPYDPVYERTAQSAFQKGAIIVAAAGNDSRRSSGYFQPVGSPADCPSILAVAALDPNLNVADFSNRSINPGGLIDIAAPGVDVYSSWPMQRRYRTISGTSMATPHVAGILSLLWEKYPNALPSQIISEMRTIARSLPLNNIDVGAGLVIAP